LFAIKGRDGEGQGKGQLRIIRLKYKKPSSLGKGVKDGKKRKEPTGEDKSNLSYGKGHEGKSF